MRNLVIISKLVLLSVFLSFIIVFFIPIMIIYELSDKSKLNVADLFEKMLSYNPGKLDNPKKTPSRIPQKSLAETKPGKIKRIFLYLLKIFHIK